MTASPQDDPFAVLGLDDETLTAEPPAPPGPTIGPSYVLVEVAEAADGTVRLRTTDGNSLEEPAIFLVCETLNEKTLQRETVRLIVPASAGAGLLRNFCSDTQWEALLNAR